MKLISYRELALRWALREAKRGVREKGGNNRGPDVEKYQRATWLSGTGWPWCMAFVVWCFRQAGYDIRRTAGVEDFDTWARSEGTQVDRPLRGDVVLFDLDGDGKYDDHTGFVVRCLSIRIAGSWLLRTVEGNTSSGEAGSQSDGDGVFVRTRLVRKSRVHFVRLKGVRPKPSVLP